MRTRGLPLTYLKEASSLSYPSGLLNWEKRGTIVVSIIGLVPMLTLIKGGIETPDYHRAPPLHVGG